MNSVLYKRNLETTTQTFHKSHKHQTRTASGSNRWWEQRIEQEPVNMHLFENMQNAKYLHVSGVHLTF